MHLVVKSNALINAMFDLSLQGNRFLAFAISQLDRNVIPTPGQPVEIEVPVLEFSKAFDLDPSNAYREIEALADQLQRKIIQLHPDQTTTGHRVKVGLITRQKYLDGEGRVWIKFDEDLVPHLLGLTSHFTRYRIKDVYQFSRASTWRVYELLKQYKEIGQREIDIEEFKRMTATTGKYPRPTDLKARVLDPAILEINATSDIQIQYEQKKKGRRVVSFLFIIRENQSTKSPREQIRAVAEKIGHSRAFSPELVQSLRSFRVSPKQALQLANLAIGKEDRVLALLPKLQARWEKLETKKTSLGGYVFRALSSELTQSPLPI